MPEDESLFPQVHSGCARKWRRIVLVVSERRGCVPIDQEKVVQNTRNQLAGPIAFYVVV
jgi:hypothetical protein